MIAFGFFSGSGPSSNWTGVLGRKSPFFIPVNPEQHIIFFSLIFFSLIFFSWI
jgi:hypothetical protein